MRRKKSTIILLTYVGIIRIRLEGKDETAHSQPASADTPAFISYLAYNEFPLMSSFNFETCQIMQQSLLGGKASPAEVIHTSETHPGAYTVFFIVRVKTVPR